MLPSPRHSAEPQIGFEPTTVCLQGSRATYCATEAKYMLNKLFFLIIFENGPSLT